MTTSSEKRYYDFKVEKLRHKNQLGKKIVKNNF